MNRRTFSALMAASISLIPTLAASAQNEVITSRLTGAEIDLSESNLEFRSQVSTDSEPRDFEAVVLRSDVCTLQVHFLLGSERLSPEALRDRSSVLEQSIEDGGDLEQMGFGELSDGAWLAWSAYPTTGPVELEYAELQLNAYTDCDLFIRLLCDQEDFAAALEEVQSVTIDGIPPFLFLEESDAEGDLFSNPSSRINTSRLAVPDRTATSRPTAQAEIATTGESGDAVEAVRTHQAQFHDELTRFEDVLQKMADGELVGADEMEFFTVMLEVTFSWQEYPATASALQFPPELSGLESTYIEWADAISQMGVTLGQVSTGLASAEDYIGAANIAIQLDQALSAELRTLGVVIEPAVQGFARPNDDISFVLKRHESSILAA